MIYAQLSVLYWSFMLCPPLLMLALCSIPGHLVCLPLPVSCYGA